MKKILKTKILLADDHRIMRAGLRSILEKQPDEDKLNLSSIAELTKYAIREGLTFL
jgi:PleD family two-component response regulator